MRNKKLRIVLGAKIHSKNDFDTHYISANRLCELYNFNENECYLVNKNDNVETDLVFRGLPRNLPIYMPRYLGDYKHSKFKIFWQEFRYRHRRFLGAPNNTVFYQWVE